MAVELATAYISLVPSTRGFTKSFESGVLPDMSKSGATIGDRLMGGLSKAVKIGAVATGAAAAAGIGVALTKGFQRLTAIDQARAKLIGLGNDTKTVKTIMNNALASVKGTAFGLDEAATTAAAVVAAGIKPGKDLTGVLKTVADTATIAGMSMKDAGAIFGSVAARGKLQGDDLMQLQSRGVPVLAMLAKHYGITAQAASDMVSAGQVDFANFEAAMAENLGGAALKSGNTFSGAFDNMGAALGRLGASLLGGIFPQLKDGFGNITTWLDALGPKAADLGKAFGAFAATALPALIDGMKTAVNVFMAGVDWVGKNIDLLRNLAIVAGIAVAAILGFRAVIAVMNAYKATMAVVKAAQLGFAAASYGMAGASYAATAATTAQRIAMVAGKAAFLAMRGVMIAATAVQWAWNVALSANPIGIIIAAIAALVAGLIWFFTQTELGQAIWKGFTDFLVDAWNNIVSFITDVITNVVNFVKDHWGMLLSFIIGPLGLAIQWIVEHWGEILDFLKPAFDAIGAVFTWIWESVIKPVVDFIVAYVKVMAAIFTWLWANILSPIFNLIGAIFNWLWNTIIKVIVDFIVGYVKVMGAIFNWLWLNILKPTFEAFGAIFTWIWESIIKPISDFISAYFKTSMEVFSWVYANIIKPAVDAMGAAFTWIWESVIKPISDFIGRAVRTVGDVVGSVFGSIGDIIRGAFEGVVSFTRGVFNGIIDAVNGVIGGINSVAGVLGDAFGFDIRLGTLPRLAEGGIVKARPGGMAAIVGEGRYDEAVVPLSPQVLDQLGGGGSRPIYVQNPFTGEYLLARVDERAEGVVDGKLAPLSAGPVQSRLGVSY